MVLLAVIITHLRRNAKLQRSLLGHVLPPAAGDKATLVITDVQGSSKLWVRPSARAAWVCQLSLPCLQ
ncbi:hypothetical protein QJQ45_000511 [Haematococcus lacustris]|nr:hypothetical protein QJQ45_000511 [Haematococcus lacustris]